MRLIFGPPYKGVAATIFGMSWARAAIFYCSDTGKDKLLQLGASMPVASTLPAIGIAAFVQVANQPIVRATIQLQDPSSTQPNVLKQLVHLGRTRGWQVRRSPLPAASLSASHQASHSTDQGELWAAAVRLSDHCAPSRPLPAAFARSPFTMARLRRCSRPCRSTCAQSG